MKDEERSRVETFKKIYDVSVSCEITWDCSSPDVIYCENKELVMDK